MELVLKDNILKEKGVRIGDLHSGQIFIDSDNDYCMKTSSEYSEEGRLITAVAVSGLSIGTVLCYEEETYVVPVNAELHIMGYV